MTETRHLIGWKEISNYIRCHPDTAKYYAEKHNLPIKTLPTGRPMAIRDEIDEWLKEQENWQKNCT